MSVSDDDIRACFPHPAFRPGQLEAIRETIDAFDGGARNVIVEAPTGVGKTPAIIALATYFTQGHEGAWDDAEAAMLKTGDERQGLAAAQQILAPHQAHMITSLKMLQDQYVKDDRDGLVRIMKGKSNYACHSPSVQSGMSCADHEAMFGTGCGRRNRPCAYHVARKKAQLARLTLHNFDSFLNQVSLGGAFPARALLSVDEAHGSDEHLIKALGFELSKDHLRRLEVDCPWDPPADVDDHVPMVAWLQAQDQALSSQVTRVADDILSLQGLSTIRTRDQERQLAAAGKRKQALEDLKRRLARYLASSDKPWALERRDQATLTFEPVRASFFAKAALLDFGQRRLFMSATVFDKGRRLMAAMNLKRAETHYIAVPCIFAAKNRRLVDMAVADTGQKAYDQSLPRVMVAVQAILDRHPGECGVIHCNSYRQAQDIRDHVKSLRLAFHGKDNREDVVNRFLSGKVRNQVLVAVVMREGYDFKDDIARFQIMIRLPFAYPDKRTKMRDEMEKGYYDWLAAIDLVQLCGRGVRNERDHCVTYCLDARLARFLKRAGPMMPAWFLDSVTKDQAK